MRLSTAFRRRNGWARWSSLALVASAIAAGAPGASDQQPVAHVLSRSQPANVLLIVADDMRYDDLAYMPKVQSLLVDKGTAFTNAYSPFPLCCPARASILTGQYAHNHGVLSNVGPYGGFGAFEDDSTLATWLTPTHTTGWVGKYLNEYGAGANDPLYVPPGWDFWRASSHGTYSYRNIVLNIGGRTTQSFRGEHSTKVIADKSVRFLSTHGHEPFFLVSSFIAPHVGTPRERDDPQGLKTAYVGGKYRDTYRGPSLPKDPSFNERVVSDKRPSVRDNPPLTKAQIAKLKESFAQRRESLRLVDDQVARLLAKLRSERELRDTYVIFLSDNGFLQGEHRIYSGKGLPYSPASHVPLVIRGPGVAGGRSVDGMAGLHDLAPTILRLTGAADAQASFPVDGRSLVPMLTDPSAGDDRTLVLEAGDENGGYAFQGIIRADGWKYVEFNTDGVNEVEMYDLDADPYEVENLADDPQYEAQRAELKAEFDRLKFCAGDQCG